jgi:hypothetical protein
MNHHLECDPIIVLKHLKSPGARVEIIVWEAENQDSDL